jgi:hypothetical protein
MSRHAGFCLPRRSAWRWVLVLCSLLWFAPSVHSQQPTGPEPPPWPPDSMPLLPLVISLSERAENLQARLTEREQQIASMKANSLLLIAQSQQSLEALRLAEESRANLSKELEATLILLATLRTDYAALSISFGNYQVEAQSQIGEIIKERNSAIIQARVWRIVAIGGITVTVVAVVVIVVILVR